MAIIKPRLHSPLPSSARRWAAVACVAWLAGGGCIPNQARDHARLLSALTDRVKTEGEQFAQFRSELDRARQRNTDTLEASALEAEQVAQHALEVWRISKDERASDIYTQVREAANTYARRLEETAALRQRQEEDLASLRSAVHIRSDKLADTAQALAALAEPPDFNGQVRFFVGYGKAVNEAVKKAREEAEAKAKDSQNAAKEAHDKAVTDAKEDLVQAAKLEVTSPTTQQTTP